MQNAFVPGRLWRIFRRSFSVSPASLFKSAWVALVIWLIALAVGASYASFMFHGRLGDYFGAGIQIFLISSIVLCLFCGFFSSNKSVVPSPQDSPLVILATLATNIVALAPAAMSDETLFMTVVATMMVSSVLTGAFHFLLGYLKISVMMRYFPYPVVGGVLAGIGALLVDGGLTLLIGQDITRHTWLQLFQAEHLIRWLPTALLAFAILLLMRRRKNVLILPLALVLSLGVFSLGQALAASSAPPPLPDERAALPSASEAVLSLSLEALGKADLGLMLSQAGNILVLVVISTFNLLAYLSASELIFQRELNFNRELTVSGGANIVAGLTGGAMTGFPAIAYSTLAHSSGGNGRVINLMLALLFLVTLAFGTAVGNLFPLEIMAGLLFFLGFSFLVDWLADARAQMPITDYVTIVAMMFVIVAFGLGWGILCGILISIIFFVMQYSQINVVRQQFTGVKYRSRIERSIPENRLLRNRGESIQIFRLQGYIFFGTGFQLYRNVRSRIMNSEPGQIRFIVLDFRMVQRLDASSAVDFYKLQQLARMHNIRVVFSDASNFIHSVLIRSFRAKDLDQPKFFQTLDHAMEWCEGKILAESHLSELSHVTVERQFESHTMLRSAEISLLRKYLRRLEVQPGDVILRQGERSDSLFLIESGKVDILLRNEYDHVVRLRSMGAGAIVGEVGFYIHRPRTATIIATKPSVLQILDTDALRKMEAADPLIAATLHNFIACVLSERLTATNHMVEELLE